MFVSSAGFFTIVYDLSFHVFGVYIYIWRGLALLKLAHCVVAVVI